MRAFRRMGITAVGAINAAIRPNGSTFAAITHIRDNDTFSRPPTDLRGSSCSMRSLLKGQGYRYYGAMMPSQRQLKISPCRDAWQIWQTNRTNRTAYLLYANMRCAWFYYK